MVDLLKFFLLLQFLTCHCTIYYDNEDWDEEEYPSDKEITVEDPSLEVLISGGYRNKDSLFTKYLVSLRTNKPTEFFGDNHYCSGALVGFRTVVTAAHCLVDAKRVITRARRIVVVLGTPNRLKHNRYTVNLSVNEVHIHPGYKRETPHDIALLVFERDIPFHNPNIKIISLSWQRPPPMTKCTTLGWGQLLYMGPYAAAAVFVDLEILEPAQCRHHYGNNFDEKTSLCVGSWNPERTTCRGDSGGPLICDGFLAGILSMGMYTGSGYKPNIFTDILHHKDWIDEIYSSQPKMLVYFSYLFFINIIVANVL